MRPELHLLRRLALLPPTGKVPVGMLARSLHSTQALVLDGLKWLVDHEKVDRETLRPLAEVRLPICPAGKGADDVPITDLLPEIRRFLADSGMTKSWFGRACMNDPNFVHRISDGTRESVRARTAEKVRAFIANYGREVEQEIIDPESAFARQLERVRNGEVGIVPAFKCHRSDPAGTLGGVVGEIL